MAVIHIQRIRNALEKLFDGNIALDDYDGRAQDEREKAFLSRSLAAYVLTLLTDAKAPVAAQAITDGFDDNGIDAVYFDRPNVLYVVQSKWFSDGNGSFSVADTKKFVSGFRDLVNLRLDRFHPRMQAHEAELRNALLSTDVRITLVLTHTATQPLSKHVQQDLTDLLSEMNDPAELVSVEVLNQSRLYDGVAGYAQRHSINLEVILNQWGHIQHPHPAYYGQIDAHTVARWWEEHGRLLFARNIRNFRGNTDVNNAVESTLRNDPEQFWYFNNGITLLCRRIQKKPVGGACRDSGIFVCEGASVVNGAQTVGVIGRVLASLSAPLENAKLMVRLMSLENCPDGFDKQVTRASNTQNRIEHRDFAALDPNQQRLASELLLDGKQYAYKSGDTEPSHDHGCSIVDASVALACAQRDIALAVQAKREIGRLWTDIEQPPYTVLFSDQTSATELWRAVEILRVVDATLKSLGQSSNVPRAEMVATHGNRFILHRVFRDQRILPFRAQNIDFEAVKAAAADATRTEFEKLAAVLEQEAPGAYLQSFFKNLTRCRDLLQKVQDFVSPPQSDSSASNQAKQGSLFQDP